MMLCHIQLVPEMWQNFESLADHSLALVRSLQDRIEMETCNSGSCSTAALEDALSHLQADLQKLHRFSPHDIQSIDRV